MYHIVALQANRSLCKQFSGEMISPSAGLGKGSISGITSYSHSVCVPVSSCSTLESSLVIPQVEGCSANLPSLAGRPLANNNILHLSPLPVDSVIARIEAAIAPQSPLGRRLSHVILRPPVAVWAPLLEQRKEALIVDVRVPPPVDLEPLARQQDAAAMGVFGGDAVLEPPCAEARFQSLDEVAHLPVERDVGHAEAGVGRRGRAAVRHALDLDEAGQAALDQLGISLGLVLDVEALDQRQAEYRAVPEALLAQDIQASLEPLPEVSVKRPVDLAQRFSV
ncbi:hypothetical protein TCAP_02770 [Tolypocladium capitatum]|uniref:Uncharacterized protein n=1 Tax=Tolypocladium capitatum TaxID=45235 RepID=A0A2K3QIE7_9HYPO|nr:hypothetical protein TCAP_02770 [Tolypocladium capitatum]